MVARFTIDEAPNLDIYRVPTDKTSMIELADRIHYDLGIEGLNIEFMPDPDRIIVNAEHTVEGEYYWIVVDRDYPASSRLMDLNGLSKLYAEILRNPHPTYLHMESQNI